MKLTVLYPVVGDAVDEQALEIDIVAVHGIGGDPLNTWTWNQKSRLSPTKSEGPKKIPWLQELLPSDLPTARVMTFGYDTPTSFNGVTYITELSKSLLHCLMEKRKKDFENRRPIIFLAHSLGGLVLKQALVYAHNDDRFQVLKNTIAGIMFFGTPHRGSEHIKYGDILQKIANITAKRDISVMKKLQRDSDTLARLTLESRHVLSRYKVVSFYETLETAVGTFPSLIVSKHSAVLDTASETQIAVDADHRTICKFLSREDNTYQSCLANIKETLRNRYDLEQEAFRGRNQHWMIPYNVTPNYTGRQNIGKRLEESCLPSKSPKRFNRCHVLYGMGGLGKTQICLKFAQDHREAFWGIFWIFASTEARIIQSLLDVARKLGLEEDVFSVMRYLSEVAENWLLIIDNADDPSIALSKYFPTGGKGSILITSRNPELAVYATVGSTSIDIPSPEEAIGILLGAAGDVGSNIATRESARLIVNALNCLPLALVQAGAYMKLVGCSMEEYMETYETHSRRALQRSPLKIRTSHDDLYWPIPGASDLFFHCIEKMGTEVSLDALDVLYFLTFVSCDINAEELLERAWVNEMKHTQSSSSRHNRLRVLCNPMMVEWQPFRLRLALDLLASYSLIRLERGDKVISIHSLIKKATRARLNKDEILKYSNVTASTLTAAAGMNLEAEEYGFREALLSHLNVFLSIHEDYFASNIDVMHWADIDVVHWAESLSSFSAAFRDGGQYERALELETRAMQLREQLLGGEHLDTLRSMNRVSRHLRDLGRSHEAATLDKRVLQTRQELLGIEHRETLESMECLASSYSVLGQLQEAITLMKRALDLRRTLFGEADDGTVTDMSHLAAYYRRFGRYLEAMKLEEAVLFKRERTLGQAHPDTLVSMNNLAVTYGEIGRVQEATILHEKVVSVSKQILGDGHTGSAIAMHNLAASYNKLGHHSEAVILEMRVLELRRGQLGKTHPNTLRAMANLATAYEAASQYRESLELRRNLLHQTETLFGHDHPATLTVMADLATSREVIGQYQDAIKLRERLLQLTEVQFGRDHLTALKARSDLATSYQITGQRQKAAELRKSLEQANESAGENWKAEGLSTTTNEPFSLSSTADAERCSSDSDSTCSDESSSSQAAPVPSVSSVTSSGAARATLVERITAAFENDLELVFAYEDLRLLMSRRKFIRKHMRLLKSYFKDLYPTTVEQRQSISFLGRSRQRRFVAEWICNRTSPNKMVVQAQEEEQNGLSRFDRLELPVNSGEESMSPLAEEIERFDFSDQDQSSDESEDSDKVFSTEAHEISASALDGLMHSLTAGVPYSQYKTSLQKLADLRCSPQVLYSVMRLGTVDAVSGLLERHFEAVGAKEFEWLQELRSLGYGFNDIAELLLDEMSNSPWILLKQPEPQRVSISPDFHTSNCVHQGGKKTNLAPRLVTTDLENTEDLKKIIAEHCGLAGVVPKSRDPKAWTGLVTFLDKGRSTASITYDIVDSRRELVSRVCEALRRFCGIASYLQKKGLCCNSFTVLRFASVAGSTVIELCTIAFGLALDLYVVLQLLINNWESPGLISRCLPRLSEIANEIILTICDANIPGNKDDIEFQSCLDKVSLAVQILTLGIYLYSQAHTGAVHPFFLTNSLSYVYLLGIQSSHHYDAKAYIRVTPSRLTCMAGVAGDVVNVFGSSQFSEALLTEQTYDLLASPANLAETWDARQLIMDASMPYERGIYAIEVGEGFISAAGESRDPANTNPKLHWSMGVPSSDFKTPFSLNTKTLIGTTAINTSCPVDEHRSWMCAEEAIKTLGAKDSYWERSEAQAGLQGGQYVIAQFNITWVKRPGTTLKHIHLRPDINLPFLQSNWGLQISYCTGVARRVSICDLLADLTPILIEALLQQPPGWDSLLVDHNIVDALKGSDFKAWFDRLVPELQSDVLRIVRYVLLILQDTGVDQSGDHLVAIWPRKGNPYGCFKIPCKGDTFWARMLQDSPDCATFAYITSLCLETHECKCQKLQTAPWRNRSVVLNTAVSLHKSRVARVDQWRPRHDQSYVIGQPGKYLVGKISISTSPATMHIPPHLDISKSILPKTTQARIKEHLREKQCTNAPAHGVIVVTRHPQLFSLGFQ